MRQDELPQTVVMRLVGGLGNQMFQYAAGYALAQRLRARLLVDLEFYERPRSLGGATPRAYELSQLGLTVPVCDGPTRNRLLRWRTIGKLLRRFDIPTPCMVYKEPHFHYDPKWELLGGDVYVSGYFNSPRYFAECRQFLAAQFLQRTSSMGGDNQRLLATMRGTPGVSMHVRRGDYVTNPRAAVHHGVCSAEYYVNALQHIRRQAAGAGDLFVFTDDPAWVRANLFLNERYTLVEHNTGADSFNDLLLMAACRHHIIANSSFSWWGAWLAQPGGVCVAPARWFSKPGIDTRDLYPPGWVLL